MSQEIQAIERSSSLLVDVGFKVVKRNPIKFGIYFVGLILCLFINGYKVSPEAYQKYEEQLSKVDSRLVRELESELVESERIYRRSKGWFSCDSTCKTNYENYRMIESEYERHRRSEKYEDRPGKKLPWYIF